jgi:hypothetical protein
MPSPYSITLLVLAIATLGGCAATTPKPAAPPTASRALGPCWLLSIEEVTNNSTQTLEHKDDSLQLVATYRFGHAEHEAGDSEHAPIELSSRTTRWRTDEWPDRLQTQPTVLCTPEVMLPPH